MDSYAFFSGSFIPSFYFYIVNILKIRSSKSKYGAILNDNHPYVSYTNNDINNFEQPNELSTIYAQRRK